MHQKTKVPKRSDVVGFDSESSSDSEGSDDNDESDKEISDNDADEDSAIVSDIDKEEISEEADDKKEVEAKTVIDISKRDEDDGLEIVEATSHKPSGMKVVQVDRLAEVVESRAKLPIIAQEQEIMEMINNHGVVVLSGQLLTAFYHSIDQTRKQFA